MHMHSLRVRGKLKEYTWVCDDEGDRDEWIHCLRLAGERCAFTAATSGYTASASPARGELS